MATNKLPHPLKDPGLINALDFHLNSLRVRHDRIFGKTPVDPDLGERLRARMQGDGEPATATCWLIVNNLVDRHYLDDPDWWGSPLGRALVWHVGYQGPYAPVPVATAALGVSRTWLYRMIGDGELEIRPDRTPWVIRNISLRGAMRARVSSRELSNR
jgi:hypothetical protein